VHTDGDLSGWSPSRLRGRHDPALAGSRVATKIVQIYQSVLRRGSSAHARVHRRRRGLAGVRCRFFRARAGSPQLQKVSPEIFKVLPRTRGFTGIRPATVGGEKGSSAHARVHRAANCGTLGHGRFFRARAGSPSLLALDLGQQMVLPRTRGFTDIINVGLVDYWGSSAHARVHRLPNAYSVPQGWFFRARAGSPPMLISSGYRSPVLPRTRGFTQVPGVTPPTKRVLPRTRGFTGRPEELPQSDRGSSAHARVHRQSSRSCPARGRFFRARAGSG
jgi:hypothetical protein